MKRILNCLSLSLILWPGAVIAETQTMAPAVADIESQATALYQQQRYPEAVVKCQRAAEMGSVACQKFIGAMFLTGQGTEKDPRQAFKWFSEAAKQGDPAAEDHLGSMYFKGLGTRRNLGQAFKLFFQAAEQGYAPAETNLGNMYRNGWGTIRDYALALRVVHQSCLARRCQRGRPSRHDVPERLWDPAGLRAGACMV